ncbi:unnamed protein product [Bursaphelenchus xylophilus]|uniref:(pine wood nematode) hypothetical protein n=1 Tax=Bursaphelenchus xylophilus TaxID=6326 RepID=A0A1I7RQL9_BURXY|nr:unnamed protein product [Bursaphelenchus xylophilus]CAG9104804.1 unnamed protein product [Bursaphelenchus xylophilus]
MSGELDWRTLHKLNEIFATSTCAVLNIAVLTLIMTEHNLALRAYRKLIILNAITELLATALMSVCLPVLQFLDGYFIVISNGPFRTLPQDLHFILVASWALGVGMSFITVPLDFVYRYYVICQQVSVKTSQILAWTLVAYLLAVWDAYWLTAGTADKIGLQDQLLNDEMWMENGTKVTFIASSIANKSYIVFSVSGTVIMSSEYIIIIFTSKRVFSKLKEQRHLMSARTLEMQRGMNRMLYAQAILPVFTGFVPLSLMWTTTALRLNYPQIGFITSTFLSWLPAVSPICTIYCIGIFKRRVIRLFRRKGNPQKESTSRGLKSVS